MIVKGFVFSSHVSVVPRLYCVTKGVQGLSLLSTEQHNLQQILTSLQLSY